MPSYAFYASLPQYHRHLAPIAAELRSRGADVTVWARTPGQVWGPVLVDPNDLGDVGIVASALDAQRAKGRAVVYVEHGSGQTYAGLAEERLAFGYAGGPDLDHVGLFCTPSERVSTRWRQAYPQASVETVGCPALDVHFRRDEATAAGRSSHGHRPVVAITSHWRGGACAETMPALPHFRLAIAGLRDMLAREGMELVGHAHPRIARRLAEDWKRLGIRYEPDPDVILATASLLIADNTSLLYEACAVGLPTLVLNGPHYRREVEHGGRFWSAVPGIQCDEPGDLIAKVCDALEDGADAQALRRTAVAWAYDRPPHGKASARAADVILRLDPTPRQGAPTMPETQDRLSEMLNRLHQLGATAEEVEQFRVTWDGADDQLRETLRRMNDTRLHAEIVNAREDT